MPNRDETGGAANKGAYIGVDTPTEAGYDAFYAEPNEFLSNYPFAEPYVLAYETCPSMDVDSGLYLPTSSAIDQFQVAQWYEAASKDFPWAMGGSTTIEIDGETKHAFTECFYADQNTGGIYVYNGNYPPVENPSEPVYKGIARKVKKIYVGVNGTARKVKKAYIGVGGVARLFFEDADDLTGAFLTFSSPSAFTIAANNGSKNWDGTLEYYDGGWIVWDGTTAIPSVNTESGNAVFLRGTGNTVITGSSSSTKWFINGTDVQCSGSIESLLDHATVERGDHPTMASYCYARMFDGCSALTQAPELSATTLASSCYYMMFYNCTSLTTAPALPATTLANNCYDYMFQMCVRLTQAPELPATTLASRCYQGMFYGCTALTQAPELPATTLADYCYTRMFYGCTGLTQAPALPATTLASNCYSNMFQGCTGLTQAPELPATTLATTCYQYMFYQCTGLTKAPELPATTLAGSCYARMFEDCTGLTQAPALPATTLGAYCYRYMFNGCTNLTYIPALPATTLKNYCYQYMFQGCSKIKLSSTSGSGYTKAYRIPKSETGTTGTSSLANMFTNTGGTFTGTPTINTTYYLSSSNTIV